jgi:hypothetical protein
MKELADFINSAPVKAFVADAILSAGVALGGVAVGTWGDAQASAGVVSFLVVRTFFIAAAKAVVKWATD